MSGLAKARSRVLVVDDTPTNLDTLIAILENDYDLIVATSGKQALDLIARGQRPDLILLDAMMPDMDGYEVCARLKAGAATREIPVIFVTARTDAASESQALAAGAVDFIHKPVNKEVVRARVKLHLDLRRRTVELALSEGRARAFMNTAMDAVVVIDAESRILEFNGAAERMFGYAASEMVGCPIERLMPREVAARHQDYVNASNVRGGSMRMASALELTGYAKDARRFPIEVTVGALGGDGARMYVGIIRDISERRRAQLELAAARARESEIAAAIQKRLLLRAPPENLRGFSIDCLTIPARTVGGDFYTFTPLGPGRLELLVADVMGKGVPAALLGSAVKGAYRRVWFELMAELEWRAEPSPAAIINALSAAIAPEMIELESFVTLSLMRFDHEQRTVTWVNAGHTPTLFASGTGERPRELAGDNLPLGVLEGERYVEQVTPFERGDAFLLYSDGVTEAVNGAGEEFGVERLARVFGDDWRAGTTPAAIVKALSASVREHAGEGPPQDDRTFVLVRVDEDAGGTGAGAAGIDSTGHPALARVAGR